MRLPVLAVALGLCGCASPPAAEVDGHAITLGPGARPLASLQVAARVPAGVDPVYARTGYLHPVHTPSGAVVTGDYGASHRHQHGVFSAWTNARFEGREVDFWNAADRQGVVELIEFVGPVGEDNADLVASLAHVDLTAPEGRKTALEETWHVSAHALPDATVIDIESRQSASESPLEVLQHPYGGFAVRGPEAWEGADGARALTSEGHGRVAGNESRARWVALSGPVEGPDGRRSEATIAVLASPDNPRAPEPVRIHPSDPYFCFAACQAGPFTIEPGATRVTRYRIVAMDGPPDSARLEELWREYAAR